MTFLFPFGHFLPTLIESFPFPFMAATTIDYLTAEKYVYCVVNSKQNMRLHFTAEALLIKLTTHQSLSL